MLLGTRHNRWRRRNYCMAWHMHMMMWSRRSRGRSDQGWHIWGLMAVMVMVHVVLGRGHVEFHVTIIATTVWLRASEHFRRWWNEWVAL